MSDLQRNMVFTSPESAVSAMMASALSSCLTTIIKDIKATKECGQKERNHILNFKLVLR